MVEPFGTFLQIRKNSPNQTWHKTVYFEVFLGLLNNFVHILVDFVVFFAQFISVSSFDRFAILKHPYRSFLGRTVCLHLCPYKPIEAILCT